MPSLARYLASFTILAGSLETSLPLVWGTMQYEQKLLQPLIIEIEVFILFSLLAKKFSKPIS
ncbi:hypothetical protein LCGC14_2073180 [marine sediment metagenome]|uniref:Uncharacterized protein n=1 Tax=marine sediment metagenome TaxID=412755 RepID=A0A0F9HEU6_9ZZZZ